jgi:hypothetical protein
MPLTEDRSMKRLAALGLCLALGACSGASANAADPSVAVDPLEGAWQVAEVVTTGPNASTNSNPQPGWRMFIDGYYTLLITNSVGPRPRLPPYDSATAEQLLAVIGPVFSAVGGAYRISGDTVSVTRIIAKNPNVAGPNVLDRSTFRRAGDSLWLTLFATADGPVANPSTVKHVKMRRSS